LKRELELKSQQLINSERGFFETKTTEERHNIKLLQELKKAHKTIDEMRKAMEGEQKKGRATKEELAKKKAEFKELNAACVEMERKLEAYHTEAE